MKSKLIILILLLFLAPEIFAQNPNILTSPDKNISVEIILKEKIYYSVSFKNERVLESSPMSLSLENVTLGSNPKLLDSKLTSVDQKIQTVWGSRKEISDQYNQLVSNFDGNFSVVFRAYNKGVAYRFEVGPDRR